LVSEIVIVVHIAVDLFTELDKCFVELEVLPILEMSIERLLRCSWLYSMARQDDVFKKIEAALGVSLDQDFASIEQILRYKKVTEKNTTKNTSSKKLRFIGTQW